MPPHLAGIEMKKLHSREQLHSIGAGGNHYARAGWVRRLVVTDHGPEEIAT